MTTTLTPVEPDVTFLGLEPLICDADDMTDVLTAALYEYFGCEPQKEGFVISAADGRRLFFLARVLDSMSGDARKAYYLAVENGASERDQGRSA